MWSRVRKSRIKRYAQVRLRVQRRDEVPRPIGGLVVRRQPANFSRRMLQGVQRIGRVVRRAAQNRLASYLRVANTRDK